MNHILVKNLIVNYSEFKAIEFLDFTADKGEFVVIVGKSGSGKTTFLKALAGLIPFSGEINRPPNIGMMFQNDSTFPWLTVSENIAFGISKKNINRKKEIINENLKLAGLSDKKNKYPAELSGGQVQRVALARSLASDHDILLMDEPYGALDACTRDKMQKWLLDVWSKNKKTIIFVTHNIEEAIFLADRILVLNNQKFVKEFIVPFERERDLIIKFSPEFNKLKKEIFETLYLKDFE